MRQKLIIVSLFITTSVMALSPDTLKERHRLEGMLKEEQAEMIKLNEKLEHEQNKLRELSAQIEQLNKLEIERDKNAMQILGQVEKRMDSMPVTAKLTSKKFKFYRCLRDHLIKEGFANVTGCRFQYNADFIKAEIIEQNSWESKLGLSINGAKKKREEIKQAQSKQENSFLFVQSQIKSSQKRTKGIEYSLSRLKGQEYEEDISLKYPEFLACNSNTPSIDLEELTPFAGASFKGPFFGVQNDNQGSIGSCYANTSKNLLVSLSGGQDIASFLDLALNYKKSLGTLAVSGLSAGTVCKTLSTIGTYGYCPQNFSPIETGNLSDRDNALIGPQVTSIERHFKLLMNLESFVEYSESIEKAPAEIHHLLVKQANRTLHLTNLNANLKLPLPILRFDIGEEWKIRETYALHLKHLNVSDDVVIREYKKAYAEFYPLMARAVMEERSPEEIFDLYKESMTPVLIKYGLYPYIHLFKKMFLQQTNIEKSSPTYKEDRSRALQFLKQFFDKGELSHEEFLTYLTKEGHHALRFLGKLSELMAQMKEDQIPLDRLLNQEGQFKNVNELMQAAVAPDCLEPNNRTQLDFSIQCEEISIESLKVKTSDQDQIPTNFRVKVLASLMQGHALGHQYASHVNTLVGMRFNQITQACEYKIRESQTGTSGWLPEKTILNYSSTLIQVRKY